jgi:hypothetical protein
MLTISTAPRHTNTTLTCKRCRLPFLTVHPSFNLRPNLPYAAERSQIDHPAGACLYPELQLLSWAESCVV